MVKREISERCQQKKGLLLYFTNIASFTTLIDNFQWFAVEISKAKDSYHLCYRQPSDDSYPSNQESRGHRSDGTQRGEQHVGLCLAHEWQHMSGNTWVEAHEWKHMSGLKSNRRGEIFFIENKGCCVIILTSNFILIVCLFCCLWEDPHVYTHLSDSLSSSWNPRWYWKQCVPYRGPFECYLLLWTSWSHLKMKRWASHPIIRLFKLLISQLHRTFLINFGKNFSVVESHLQSVS